VQITSNTTPYASDLFVFTDKHGQKHCVVVVKATFSVDVGGRCLPSPEQVPLVYTDEHFGDPAHTAIRFESEFVPLKPRAEVLLHAQAVAGQDRAVTALDISLAGPGVSKSSLVIGDRIWEQRLMGIKASPPNPFTIQPIAWHYAFGGSDVSHEQPARHGHEPRNLVGRGFHLNDDRTTIVGKPLPNIERPNSLMQSWSDRPDPIGFGPVGRGWQPRIEFAGTYDQRWMDEDLPFLPPDFDPLYFQSAPVDQQLANLHAGSVFQCLNMNASGRFDVELPAWTVPVSFLFDDRQVRATLEPDTLILEPGLARAMLIGRARVPLPRKATALKEIEIGPRARSIPAGKRHYRSLGEAVAALRKRKGSS